MRRVIRYQDGRKVWSDNEPARGRVHGYGNGERHPLTPVVSEVVEAADVRQPASLREVRP